MEYLRCLKNLFFTYEKDVVYPVEMIDADILDQYSFIFEKVIVTRLKKSKKFKKIRKKTKLRKYIIHRVDEDSKINNVKSICGLHIKVNGSLYWKYVNCEYCKKE